MKVTSWRMVLVGLIVVLGVRPVSGQKFGFSAVNANIPGVTNRGVTGASSAGFLNTTVGQRAGLQANGLATMNTVDVGVGDFNGDGIQDIVAVSAHDTNRDGIPDTTRLTVFLGVGDGTFGFPLVFELVENGGIPIALSIATSLVVGDIDLDGVSDVVVAVRVIDSSGIDASRVLFINGKSLMTTPQGAFLAVLNLDANAHLPGLTSTAVSVAIGRLTSDLTPGIAVALAGNPGGAMLIVRDPDCQCFAGPRVTKQIIRTKGLIEDPWLTRLPVPRAIAIGKSNLPPVGTTTSAPNADLDVLVATSAGIEVAQNDGGGGFSSPTLSTTFRAGTLPVGVLVADVNGDNLPDVIALNLGSGSVSTFIARKGGGYLEPATSGVGAILGTSLSLFDFDNDRFPDLVIASSGYFGFGNVSVLRGNGTGRFAPTKVFNNLAGFRILNPSSVAAGKFDLRSLTDDIVVAELGFPLVVVDSGGAMYVSAAAKYNLVPIPTQPSTSSVVSSSPNPSSLGQPVVFTATVTASEGQAGGVVSFNDSGISFGKATLDGLGQATFTTSSLAQGSHNVTVTFFHNSNFGGSTSAVLRQTVQPAVMGTFTLTVVDTSPGALGAITGGPFFCFSTCSASFSSGATVVLTTETFLPATWSGCDSVDSTNVRCTVIMNADKTVTAH